MEILEENFSFYQLYIINKFSFPKLQYQITLLLKNSLEHNMYFRLYLNFIFS